MTRFGLGAMALALVLAGGCVAPGFAQDDSSAVSSIPDPAAAPDANSTVPDDLQGLVGSFILEQEDETLPKCPITLTDQTAPGGWGIELPEACPAPYPTADQLKAWNVDANDGSLLLLDASGKTVMHLFEDEDGAYDTDPNVTPRFYMLPPDDAAGNGGENDAGD